jgi:plasmid stabilization system protein ParE
MAKVAWTFEAERWLADIYDYIASDNPAAAAETVQGIYDRAQMLQDFPETGYRYQSSSRNVRILLYGHYRITYLVRIDGDIDVLGVFHGALDISKYQL